jgi:ATP-dependent Lon protease
MDDTTDQTTDDTNEATTGTDRSASTQNLPLLPLTSGVVLPGMVFTMALESEEAKAATEAAEAAGGHFVIVPLIDGRYSSVGVVAEVMEKGDLPGGMPAVAVRGVERARLGTAVPGTGRALWVEVEILADEGASDEAAELAREYRAVVENILVSRGAGRLAERLGDVTDPGRVADMAGYSPTCPWLRRWRSWRPSTSWPGCGWSSPGPVRSWPT